MAKERAVVTAQERAAAAELVAAWSDTLTVKDQLSSRAQLELVGMVTAALADARDGATIPGERQDVGQHVDVHGDLWREHPEVQEKARRDVRRGWAQTLHLAGMRPLGWPPVVVTFLRFREVGYRPMVDDPLVECEGAEQADLVRLTISGPAVAL